MTYTRKVRSVNFAGIDISCNSLLKGDGIEVSLLRIVNSGAYGVIVYITVMRN